MKKLDAISICVIFAIAISFLSAGNDAWTKSGSHYSFTRTSKIDGTEIGNGGIKYTFSVGVPVGSFDTSDGATTGSPSGINLNISPSTATGEVEYTSDSLPVSDVGITMSGRLIVSGGGSGTLTWGASAVGEAPFYIQSNQDGGAKEIVVPAGESITYTAYEGSSTKSSKWKINNTPPDGDPSTASIIFNRSWWDVAGWFDPGVNTPNPGIYTIWASPTDSTDSDTGSITIVGIDEIRAKLRTAANYSSVSGTLYAAVGDVLNVKAIMIPSGCSWPTNTPEWSTSGDEWFSDRVSGISETASVDTSSEEDGFDIIATCGYSEKSITVAIYQCKFIAYVKSPLGGPVGITGILDKTITVGHTFWQLQVSDFALNYLKNNELSSYSQFLNSKRGFYPNFTFISGTTIQTSGSGILNDDASHSYDDHEEYDISYNNLVSGLAQTKSLANSPGTYILGTHIKVTEISSGTVLHDATYAADRNCTSVCKMVASGVGVTMPASYVSNYSVSNDDWTLEYSGNCPYSLDENM